MAFWDNWFGNSSAPATVDVYQQMADGTHLVRYNVDPNTKKPTGSPTDLETVAAKRVPVDKPVLKDTSQGTIAVLFNPDGSVKQSEILAPPKTPDPSLSGYRDAETAYTQQKLAEAEAMAPYNQDKAASTIANLKSQINARDDLEPARKQLLLAQADKTAKLSGTYDSVIRKNNALGALDQAKADKVIGPVWATAQGELAKLQEAKTSGAISDDQYATAKTGIINQAILDAQTGLTSAQRATGTENAANTFNTQENDRMGSADRRAATASNLYNTTLSTATGLAKGMAPGQGDIAAKGFQAMLNMGRDNVSQMGGDAYKPQENGFLAQMKSALGTTSAPVTDLHKAQIADLVLNKNVPFNEAVIQTAQGAGVIPPDASGRYGGPNEANAAQTAASGMDTNGNLNPGVTQGVDMPGY